MAKKLFFIFILAFGLNWIYENLHSGLYVHYRGDPISPMILGRAALIDALFITGLGILFLKLNYFKERPWCALLIGIAAAIGLELFALKTGRWAYQTAMPIVPLIGTGLTPTVQLGLLSYLIFKIVR